jgi:hypothetical protein
MLEAQLQKVIKQEDDRAKCGPVKVIMKDGKLL